MEKENNAGDNSSKSIKLERVRALAGLNEEERRVILYNSLAKMQAELPVVLKNAKGFNYKYADFSEVVMVSRPILSKYGLFVIQFVDSLNKDFLILETRVCHYCGAYIQSRIPLIVNEDGKNQNKLQRYGAAITYLKRYQYCAMLGIVTDDDSNGK